MKIQHLHPKKHILTILIFIIAVPIHAQQIKNLVFEGAGIRGLAYAGAINELEARGLLDQVEKTGGTSAGAIMAMMVSLGYTSSEIDSIISTTNFRRFNDGHMMFPGGIRRMKNFSDYITAFYIYTLENLNRNMLTTEDWERTISISSVGIGPKIKRLSKKQKDKLIRSGKKSTAKYLNNKNPG